MKRASVCVSVCPSDRLSVCPVDRQQQRRPAGLLLSALRTGDIGRQLPAGTSAAYLLQTRSEVNAGSATLTAGGRG